MMFGCLQSSQHFSTMPLISPQLTASLAEYEESDPTRNGNLGFHSGGKDTLSQTITTIECIGPLRITGTFQTPSLPLQLGETILGMR
jgi:hypothetical protein